MKDKFMTFQSATLKSTTSKSNAFKSPTFKTMTVDRALRMLAGFFILLTLALAHWVSPWWLLFTAFVGLNLLQSAFTNWCPAMAIFRWIGLPDACATKDVKDQTSAAR
jgi:hypothetical protein